MQSGELTRKRAAIAQLHESHYGRVVRYVALRIGNRADAEDLASEVFVRALRSVDSYKDTGAPMEAWLFRIAHNMVVDYLRRKTRRHEASLEVHLENGLQPSVEDHDPIEEMEQQARLEAIKEAMSQLSETQRQVLAMRFSDGGSSAEEIAAALGKKAGAVREMQSAALKKLRLVLGVNRAQERSR